jgi:hypothetical protein
MSYAVMQFMHFLLWAKKLLSAKNREIMGEIAANSPLKRQDGDVNLALYM